MPTSTENFEARILIVDDQPSNVRLLEHTLGRGGFVAVSSTGDPRAVAALHTQNRYELIILDLQMPEIDGFQVMEELHRVAAPRPVTILVMSADAGQATAALEAGAGSFLRKPFVLTEVVERVTLMLETACGDRAGSEDDSPSAIRNGET
jgi:CheY-like chemotaxis protein